MRPSAFAYSRPGDVAGILHAMRGGAVPLAGGQSLLQAMRLRQIEPAALVDLGAASDLSAAIEVAQDRITIGARVTHRNMTEHAVIAAEFPWLAEAARALGDVQVRNRGTVIGNLCWADPRANWCVAMAASNAVVRCANPVQPGAAQTIAIDDFFTGFRDNALQGRLALSVELPRGDGGRGIYREFSRQRQDLALVNVCIVLGHAGARVAVGGVHHIPLRLPMIEALLDQEARITPALSRAIAIAFDDPGLIPLPDPHGSASYKAHLACVQLRRALLELFGEVVP